MLEKLKKFDWGYILISLALTAMGVCLIAMNNALKALAITIGCIVVVGGIIFGILALVDKRRSFAFAFKIFFAVACLVAGTLTLIFNEGAADLIIAMLALLLIIDASFKLNTTVMSKRYLLPMWWVELALSIATIVISFIMIRFTPDDIAVASVMLGIAFIIDAIANIVSPFFISVYRERQKSESYAEVKAELTESEEAEAKEE